ncbi:hypothetical protein AB0953_26770 [Streptomyces sp. NPDC046866]|uniref:hypothetical protein n=1 Tax=Streptomyces sp. NPDC046866 TaxID=3154921 RepID=UPI0034513913
MTLSSERAEPLGPAAVPHPSAPPAPPAPPGAAAAATARTADRVHEVLRVADPEAVWAFGGPDGPLAGSEHGRYGDRDADAHADFEGEGVGEGKDGGEGAGRDVGALFPVLALWPVIGSLVAEEVLRLHTPLTAYGHEAAADTPSGTTTHHLLTHPGGRRAAHTAHAALTRLAEHLGGGPLAELAATRIWQPLGMTGTRCTGGTLEAPLADLGRFLGVLLGRSDHPVPRTWTTESLRIRTGELTPARGLLWYPGPHGTWTYGDTAAVWVAPALRRWAVLLPAAPRGPLRTSFREAVFAPAAR